MSDPGSSDRACSVVGGNKLPAALGGERIVCQAIEKALAAEGVSGPVTVAVTVRSRYALAATITRRGKVLPELTMDVSDSAVTKSILDSFAQAIAQAAAAGV